jgi:hypothetical protein
MPDGMSRPTGLDKLNTDQRTAHDEIMAACRPGTRHLLTGDAGSGKTFLLAETSRTALKRGLSVAVTAPTHKAVAVLRRKLADNGLSHVPCRTTQSLLSLRPKVEGDRQVFVRNKKADPVLESIVVVDECSMPGEDLMGFIRRYLPNSFVLFSGDRAQLPPIGEIESQSFQTKSRSHLSQPVRQGADNPILTAAGTLRRLQDKTRAELSLMQSNAGLIGTLVAQEQLLPRLPVAEIMTWDWAKPNHDGSKGVFVPRKPEEWMRKAFTSDDFNADPDTFRYVAWTNEKVAQVNRNVRMWRYGAESLESPFLPGERALFRGPLIKSGNVLYSTNEEATVLDIASDTFCFSVPKVGEAEEWVAMVPSWRIEMTAPDGSSNTIHMPADERIYKKVVDRIVDETALHRERWQHMHDFKAAMANLQAIYAMTGHTSQGSTHRTTFMDINNVRRRVESNLLEALQLYYVILTRPTDSLIVV